MSLDACIRATSAELGLDERDVREIADRLARHKKRLEASGRADRAEQDLRRYAAEQAEQVRIAAALRRRQAAMNIMLRDEWDRDLATLRDEGLDRREAVLAKLVGSYAGVRLSRKSVSARRTSLEGEWLGGMLAEIERDLPHVVPLLRRPGRAKPLMDNVVREMREMREGGRPGITGDADAKTLARIFRTYSEAARVELNRVGANIGRLDGWSPQAHDSWKVGRANADEWAAFVLPRLDLERSFPDVEPERLPGVLREIHRTIVTGEDRSLSPQQQGLRVGPANLARGMEKHRELHFRDADSWIQYGDRFGRAGGVLAAMVDHLHAAARKASLMQVMGPNPQLFLDGILGTMRQDVRDGTSLTGPEARRELDRLDADLYRSTGKIGRAFAEVMGDTFRPGSVTAAHIGAGLRAVQSMAKLGAAVLSSIADLVTFAHAMRRQGRGIFSGYADAFAALGQRQTAERQQIAKLLGVGYDTMLGDIHGRFTAEDNVPGWMTRASQTFFRLSGLTWWTDRLTNAFARMSSAYMADHAGMAFDALPDPYRRMLESHGIDDARWDTVRRALFEAEDGVTYVVPGQVEDAETARILRGLFADEASFAVLRADDRTRMFLTQGSQPGTPLGEAIRFIMQFKSFPIAFTQKVLGRGIKERDYGGLAELIAASWVFGYAAMAAKDLVKNRTPKDPTRWETLVAALIQGGGAGIYGDFLFAKQDRFGGGVLGKVAGPTLGTAADTIEMWQGIAHGDARAGDAWYLGLNNTPFLNLWWLRAALDLAVLNTMQEWISPGTLQRREKRLRKDFGQEYIFEPEPLR